MGSELRAQIKRNNIRPNCRRNRLKKTNWLRRICCLKRRRSQKSQMLCLMAKDAWLPFREKKTRKRKKIVELRKSNLDWRLKGKKRQEKRLRNLLENPNGSSELDKNSLKERRKLRTKRRLELIDLRSCWQMSQMMTTCLTITRCLAATCKISCPILRITSRRSRKCSTHGTRPITTKSWTKLRSQKKRPQRLASLVEPQVREINSTTIIPCFCCQL